MAICDKVNLMERREYPVKMTVNGALIDKVIIDPHYEENHSESMDDNIILELVSTLDGQYHELDEEDPPHQYFVLEGIELEDKEYKLIWLLEENEGYIGIVNAFRWSK